MRNKTKILKVAIALLAAVMLLSPPLLTALVWTPVNLYIAFIALLFSMAIRFTLPKCKWIGAIITAALIAIPPYPHWLNFNNYGEVQLNPQLFLGDFAGSAILFVIAMLCFFALFWASNGKGR